MELGAGFGTTASVVTRLASAASGFAEAIANDGGAAGDAVVFAIGVPGFAFTTIGWGLGVTVIFGFGDADVLVRNRCKRECRSSSFGHIYASR